MQATKCHRLRTPKLHRLVSPFSCFFSDYYKIRFSELIGRRRTSAIVFPRQVAMYISRTLTSDPLKSIGDAFGGRDHGTVIHACKQVENMMDQDGSVKRGVDYLIKQLSKERS